MFERLSPRFDRLYSTIGRPSIAPEKLLRALLLQGLYTVRSEALLMEQLQYNLLFRWFVGLSMDDPVWDPTVFSKIRDRLSKPRDRLPSGDRVDCSTFRQRFNHSVKAPLDIGLTEPRPSHAGHAALYAAPQDDGANASHDRSRAGGDIGKFKGPILRGLAARAPYFHNGADATLPTWWNSTDRRFGIGLTARTKADLAAFLRAL